MPPKHDTSSPQATASPVPAQPQDPVTPSAPDAPTALSALVKAFAPRLLVLGGGDKNTSLDEKLASLGYDVVADTAVPEQVLSLIAAVLPDAVLVLIDTLEAASAIVTIRHIRERYSCAVIVLTGDGDAAHLDPLKAVRPHGIVSWPVAGRILDAGIQSALSVASGYRRALPLAVPPAWAASDASISPEITDMFALASARASRTGSSFAVGAVEIAPATNGLDLPAEQDLVVQAAERLKQTLRQTDVVVRRGHRDLLFLVEQIGAPEIDTLGARMVRAISDPPQRQNGPVAAVPAIGMALWSSAKDAPATLFQAADHALHEAKRLGAFRWRVASPTEGGAVVARGEYCVVPSAEPRGPLSVLQRAIGWLSLGALVWVLANYAGVTGVTRLSEQAWQHMLAWWWR